MKVIDRDAVIRDVGKYPNIGTLNEEERIALIMSIPTIDAVEVVRCRYCKWADKCSRNVAMRETYGMYEEIYFCSYGERSEP